MKKLICFIVGLLFSCSVWSQNTIVGYEYWFDFDFQNRVIQTTSGTSSYFLTDSVSMAALASGVHHISYRFKQNTGLYSSVALNMFIKLPQQYQLNQRKIASYEYWFNGDLANIISGVALNSASFLLVDSASVNNLPDGMNSFSVRFKDDGGFWSAVATHYFIKTNGPVQLNQRNITRVEYWLNNDFSGKSSVATSSSPQFVLLDSVNVTALPNGVNTITYRFLDDANLASSPATHFFIKNDENVVVMNKQLILGEYWFNKDYANRSTMSFTPASGVSFIDSLNIAGLNFGVNEVNCRFKDEHGLWSSPFRFHFIKMDDPPVLQQSNIVAYRYWLGNDVQTARRVEMANHAPNFYLIDSLDLRHISAGSYELHMQTLDNLGEWSSAVSDTINKVFYPYVSFEADNTTICQGETVTFTYDAADVNLLVWSYGIGAVDTTTTPSFTYNQPGIYSVGVAAIHTDSNITLNYNLVNYITVIEAFDSTVAQSVCQGDSVLFNGFWHAQDSLYSYDYQTPNGCDSTWSLDLTVLLSSTGSMAASICQGQMYNFGSQVLTASGTYVETFMGGNGCDSIVTLNLAVKPTYSKSIADTICDGDIYVFGSQNLTTSGSYSETFASSYSCDSIVNLQLLVHKIDTSVMKSGITLTANATNADYQWLDCGNGYSPIASATGKSFTPTVNGYYAVAVAQNGCVDTSSCMNIANIGIVHWQIDKEVRIYPNPTNGLFAIDFANQVSIDWVEVYAKNQLMFRIEKPQGQKVDIDLRSYPSGVYTVNFFAEGQLGISRIVKID